MSVFVVIFEWLLVIAILGLIGVLVWLALAVLSVKKAAMRDVKRLYEPPLRSVKSLVGTGKGIVQQESVRARHIGDSVKVAAGAVKVTASEVKIVAESVRFSDLKPILANIQNVLKLLSLAGKMRQAVSVKQGPVSDG